MEKKGTVLILDQDLELASILSGYLTAQGLRVQFTTRVREALRKLSYAKFAHVFIDPDLNPDHHAEVLMELSSGSGLNALTPITLMTANLETKIQMPHVKRLQSILIKPFTLKEFIHHFLNAGSKASPGGTRRAA